MARNSCFIAFTFLLFFGSNAITNVLAGRAKEAANVATPPPEKRKLTSADLALSGAVATMIGDASLHPIDCIKTLQQSTEGMGLSFLGAASKIYKDSGPAGFFAGIGSYVTCDGGAGAVKFATYEALKQWVNKNIPEEYTGSALFGCAAIAFVASSVILVPGELIKQRLQMGQISSIKQGISTIWKNDGILGFFAGYSGVCARDIPYTMLELGLYDNFKSLYLKFKNRNMEEGSEKPITQFDEIIAAAITGGITGYLTNPLDVIKTKLMVDSDMYKGFIDCFRKSVSQHGISSLFQGGLARVAWLVPFTAIYLPVYEVFKRRLELYTPKATASDKTQSAMKVKGGSQYRVQSWDGSAFLPVPSRSVRFPSESYRNSRHRGTYRLDGNECFVSF